MSLPENLVDDVRFFPRLERLVTALGVELDAAHSPARCYHGLMVGTQAAPLGFMKNGTGCGGVSWVRPVSAFPTDVFPNPDQEGGQRCNSPLVMEVEVGVARPLPRPEGREMYPDPQEVYNSLRLYMSDLAAMKRAILCRFMVLSRDADDRDVQIAIGAWNPIEGAAGVSGGTWQAWVG